MMATSRRTSSTASAVVSMALGMDLHAASAPVRRSVHARTTPNCPRPSSAPSSNRAAKSVSHPMPGPTADGLRLPAGFPAGSGGSPAVPTPSLDRSRPSALWSARCAGGVWRFVSRRLARATRVG